MKNKPMKALTPSQIVNELDKYIIGQTEAKRAVAIALRNRWRRQQIPDQLREEILPNNIILIGPTGVGKTEIARRLAKLAEAPFVKVEASKFTEVGYVGRDVESMIRDLADYAVNMVKSEKTAEVQSKAEELAYEKILDFLIPPVKKPHSVENGEGEVNDEAYQNQKTREWMKQKLKSGELDSKMIEFDANSQNAIGMQVLGPFGLDDLGINFQEIMGNIMPKKKRKEKPRFPRLKLLLPRKKRKNLLIWMPYKKKL